MKSRVKHCDLRYFGSKDLPYGENALDVVGVVKVSQVNAVLDSLQHLVGDDNRLSKQFTAVNHSMPAAWISAGVRTSVIPDWSETIQRTRYSSAAEIS